MNQRIKLHGKSYVIEIMRGETSEGIIPAESIQVEVCDEGGGCFLAIKCVNNMPTEIYDDGTVCLDKKDIGPLCAALHEILDRCEEVEE